jgi:hypothetical protein
MKPVPYLHSRTCQTFVQLHIPSHHGKADGVVQSEMVSLILLQLCVNVFTSFRLTWLSSPCPVGLAAFQFYEDLFNRPELWCHHCLKVPVMPSANIAEHTQRP